MSKKQSIIKEYQIPIYGAELKLVVAKDSYHLTSIRKEFNETFGEYASLDNPALVSFNNDGEFALFIIEDFTVKTVSHEIFHLTHRICEWANVKFDSENQESFALLNGYLSDLIINELFDIKNRFNKISEINNVSCQNKKRCQ